MQASRQRLEAVLGRARLSLEELDRKLKADTRKTQARLRELSTLIGAAKAAQCSNSHVRRLLAGDTSAAADVLSLRPAVDYFFGRRPPMDERGRTLQRGVIDHRASGFSKPVRAMLVEEVMGSVSKRLWLHVKNTCGHDHAEARRQLQRTKELTSAQILDEAERANICLADPRCKVWEEVGQVMWKASKKCAAECRVQFLNNDDPRLSAEADSAGGSAAADAADACSSAGASHASSGRGAGKTRPVACKKCSARKKKCSHVQETEARTGQQWSKLQAQRLAHMVAEQVPHSGRLLRCSRPGPGPWGGSVSCRLWRFQLSLVAGSVGSVGSGTWRACAAWRLMDYGCR